MKTLETTHLIRFQDCDPFGHLNNSRYIDYFINAREDHLSAFYNFSPFDYSQKTGNGWVVGGHQIAYLSAAMLMQKVIISSVLIEWNENNILLEMTMWNEGKTRCISVIRTRFVHVKLKEMKRTEHGEMLNNKFNPEVHPTLSAINFDDRVAELKNLKS